MSSVQIADQTFVAAPAAAVAALVSDTRRWPSWFSGLTLTVQEDRAEKGIRWAVSGELHGTMEVWLEPMLDGVVMHYFLHADPLHSNPLHSNPLHSNPKGDPGSASSAHRRRVAGKAMSFEIKASLEQGRAVGESPVSSS
ncbi:MAG: polyketide cyclase / dehydrase and lipid transport [Rhodococcus sp. (in: high G+C Gram-positive bacteria)]